MADLTLSQPVVAPGETVTLTIELTNGGTAVSAGYDLYEERVMRLLSNLFSDRGERARWEAGLSWFRLRYRAAPTRAINLLSRPEACGRVALYYRPGSHLYLGLPERYARLLARMAADFGFSLAPKPP